MRLATLALASLWLGFAAPTPSSATQYVIEIKGMEFGPSPPSLHVGDTILWKNSDIVRHTATAKSKEFDLMLKPGQSQSMVLGKAGRISVFCRYHPDMTMQLSVRE